MIAPEDELAVEWLAANDVVLGPAQVCDLQQAEFYRALMADGGAGAHVAPPIVGPDPDVPGRFFIRDGKHRYLAQLALGRDRIRCLVVRPAG
ncbi:hypothetical protein K1T35_47620 (plasmid) [Pseudonocardia sp. DSM 110487]|uniref:hypothetical protein n=1 Tax=Pseudonocardia sp. DSM 110487 TaxID=2865833 RepID=UPI001C69DA82|nr:hypothetical protein [Pseudonocardia sp. DSM 110487]QYN41020.1 hypothetical protein K1T35_47620 [Pseudonocardia sp. DSM 110487]